MRKVIVLGLDGFDPVLTEKLMSKGTLKNFAKLARKGFYSRLKTSIPPESPVVWSSIATGVNPGEHGIFDFIVKSEKGYLPTLSIPKIKKSTIFSKPKFHKAMGTPAFWELSSNNKIPTTVIKWPATFPAGKVYGKMLSGMGVPDPDLTLGRYTLLTNKEPKFKEPPKGKITVLKFRNGIAKHGELNFKIVSSLSLSVTLGGKDFVLKKHVWSQWVELSQGIVRFYLNSVSPYVSIYQTSVHPNPKKTNFPISSPQNYGRQIFEKIGFFHTLGIPEETNGVTDKVLTKSAFEKLSKILFDEREKLFWSQFSKFNEGLFAFVFDSTDRFQHIFGLGKQTMIYYKKVDQILGKIINKVDDNTLLLVISDHGFVPFRKAIHLNSWLRKNGYLTLSAGKKSRYLFENVDWDKTYAFAMGFTSIYINRKNRQMFSVDDLKNKLLKLTDEETKERVIANVYAKEDIYRGRFMENAPDLVVGTIPPYRVSSETAVGGVPENIIEENKKDWQFDHIVDAGYVPGIFFSNKKMASSPTVYDISGIVLSFFGIKKSHQ